MQWLKLSESLDPPPSPIKSKALDLPLDALAAANRLIRALEVLFSYTQLLPAPTPHCCTHANASLQAQMMPQGQPLPSTCIVYALPMQYIHDMHDHSSHSRTFHHARTCSAHGDSVDMIGPESVPEDEAQWGVDEVKVRS